MSPENMIDDHNRIEQVLDKSTVLSDE